MTHWMTTLSDSKDMAMIVFGSLAVFAVVGLEIFRKWLGHAPREERGWRAIGVAAILGLVFLGKLLLGGAGLATEGKNFVDLSLVMFGIAGVLVVATLMWRFRRGLPLGDAEEEQRRIAAHDL